MKNMCYNIKIEYFHTRMSPPTRADLGREGNNGLGTDGALVALATGLAACFGGILMIFFLSMEQ